MEFYVKNIPTLYMKIGDNKFPVNNVLNALIELEETSPDDSSGDFSIHDYNLEDESCTKTLVDIGLASHYTGSRMASLYKIKDVEKVATMKEGIYDFYDKQSDEDKKVEVSSILEMLKSSKLISMNDSKVIIEKRNNGLQPAIFIISENNVYLVTVTPTCDFEVTYEGCVGERYDENGKWIDKK